MRDSGLSQVLTPGVDSHSGWKNYTKHFEQIAKPMPPICPARQAGRLGTYWTTQIGTQRVTLFGECKLGSNPMR